MYLLPMCFPTNPRLSAFSLSSELAESQGTLLPMVRGIDLVGYEMQWTVNWFRWKEINGDNGSKISMMRRATWYGCLLS